MKGDCFWGDALLLPQRSPKVVITVTDKNQQKRGVYGESLRHTRGVPKRQICSSGGQYLFRDMSNIFILNTVYDKPLVRGVGFEPTKAFATGS